jgi:hypothetical protein
MTNQLLVLEYLSGETYGLIGVGLRLFLEGRIVFDVDVLFDLEVLLFLSVLVLTHVVGLGGVL